MIKKIRLHQLVVGDTVVGHNGGDWSVDRMKVTDIRRAPGLSTYTAVALKAADGRTKFPKYSDRDYSGRDEPFFFVDR